MTTSTVLRTLESKGLLKQHEHSKDTRTKTVVLTDLGIKIVKQALKTVEQFDNIFLQSLGNKSINFNMYLSTLIGT